MHNFSPRNRDIPPLVADFLLHAGYTKTVESLQRNQIMLGPQPSSEVEQVYAQALDNARGRAQVRALLLSGDVDAAIRAIEDSPLWQKAWAEIGFDLKIAKLTELIITNNEDTHQPDYVLEGLQVEEEIMTGIDRTLGPAHESMEHEEPTADSVSSGSSHAS